MALHGGPTPKRTLLYSCMREISCLDLGPLKKEVREALTGKPLVRCFVAVVCGMSSYVFFTRILTIPYMANDLSQGKYRDKAGRERFHGTPALKKSQHFGLDHSIYIYI